jgi:hypothetical protein
MNVNFPFPAWKLFQEVKVQKIVKSSHSRAGSENRKKNSFQMMASVLSGRRADVTRKEPGKIVGRRKPMFGVGNARAGTARKSVRQARGRVPG